MRIPSRLLLGIVPEVLLRSFHFWQYKVSVSSVSTCVPVVIHRTSYFICKGLVVYASVLGLFSRTKFQLGRSHLIVCSFVF